MSRPELEKVLSILLDHRWSREPEVQARTRRAIKRTIQEMRASKARPKGELK